MLVIPMCGGMLCSSWCRVVAFFEGPGSVAGHGDVDVALGIMPVEGEAAVEGT